MIIVYSVEFISSGNLQEYTLYDSYEAALNSIENELEGRNPEIFYLGRDPQSWTIGDSMWTINRIPVFGEEAFSKKFSYRFENHGEIYQ